MSEEFGDVDEAQGDVDITNGGKGSDNEQDVDQVHNENDEYSNSDEDEEENGGDNNGPEETTGGSSGKKRKANQNGTVGKGKKAKV
jgi:hypothetical protein